MARDRRQVRARVDQLVSPLTTPDFFQKFLDLSVGPDDRLSGAAAGKITYRQGNEALPGGVHGAAGRPQRDDRGDPAGRNVHGRVQHRLDGDGEKPGDLLPQTGHRSFHHHHGPDDELT